MCGKNIVLLWNKKDLSDFKITILAHLYVYLVKNQWKLPVDYFLFTLSVFLINFFDFRLVLVHKAKLESLSTNTNQKYLKLLEILKKQIKNNQQGTFVF